MIRLILSYGNFCESEENNQSRLSGFIISYDDENSAPLKTCLCDSRCGLLYQGCFRRNVTVVTIYASLGEEALCHSLNEVPFPLPLHTR